MDADAAAVNLAAAMGTVVVARERMGMGIMARAVVVRGAVEKGEEQVGWGRVEKAEEQVMGAVGSVAACMAAVERSGKEMEVAAAREQGRVAAVGQRVEGWEEGTAGSAAEVALVAAAGARVAEEEAAAVEAVTACSGRS